MTDFQKACLEKLKEQTKNKSGTVNMVGRQIWDLVRTHPDFAEIICTDLDNPNMTVSMCEGRIHAAADERHKTEKGSCAAISPAEAENIIRKFYGLPEIPGQDPFEETDPQSSPDPAAASGDNIINLEDFL